MNEEAERPVELTDIKGLSNEPSEDEEPDKQTRKEIAKSRRATGKPSPLDRFETRVNLQIKDLCEERKRLSETNKELQCELDRIRPEIAKLKEAFAAAVASNIFSTAMVGLGGALISGAGYASNDSYKLSILFFGVASFGWGLILQVSATWRNTVFRR